MHDTKADPAARISAAAKVIEFGHGRASSGEPVIVTQVNVRLDAQDQSL
jgi:hypothetical protein